VGNLGGKFGYEWERFWFTDQPSHLTYGAERSCTAAFNKRSLFKRWESSSSTFHHDRKARERTISRNSARYVSGLIGDDR